MLRAPRILCPLLTVLLAASASAQHKNSPIAPCKDLDTVHLYDCFAREYDQADRELNQEYAQIRSVLQQRPDDEKRLLEAQRIWLRYRDATCSAARELYGDGTAGPPAEVECRKELTNERTSVLRATYGWLVDKFSK